MLSVFECLPLGSGDPAECAYSGGLLSKVDGFGRIFSQFVIVLL